MTKLFIALKVPEPIKDQLSAMKSRLPGARFVPRENLHLTLYYFGETSETIFARVSESLDLLDLREQALTYLSPLSEREDRKIFIPHVTLARLKNVPINDLRHYLKENRDFVSDPFFVDCFFLISSTLTNEGPVYKI